MLITPPMSSNLTNPNCSQPANLKPAEDWEIQVPWTIINPKPRIQIIRQIQADALRWAASKINSFGYHDAGYILDSEANQLDPKPEGKA